MPMIGTAQSLFLAIASATAAVRTADSTLICFAPVTAQMAGGQNAETVTAVRDAMGSYLTGPTLGVVTLAAKLPSQAREEAKRAGCRAVLFVSVKHERSNPSSLLGKVAGRVETQAWQAAARARTAAAKELAQTAAKTARDVAGSIKSKDELSLGYRLESPEGAVLASGTDKRKAGADGEDLMTPLIEHAAEAIAAAVAKP